MIGHDETAASPRRRIVTPRWTATPPADAPPPTPRRARTAPRPSVLARPPPVLPPPDAKAAAGVFVTEPDWLLSMLAPHLAGSPRGELRARAAREEVDDSSTREAYAPTWDDGAKEDDEAEELAAPRAGVADAIAEGLAPPNAPDVLAQFHTWRALADSVARDAWLRLRRAPSLAELTSHAREALWMAARRFDPSRGLAFEAWAKLNVRGAVIDCLRSAGFTARPGRRVSARLALTGRLGDGHARAEELARAQCAALAACFGPVFVGPRRQLCDAVARDDRSPDDLLATAQLGRRVRAVLASLGREDRQLLEHYFLEEATLDEVGLAFGITKSWTSRRVNDAVGALTRALRRAGVEG